MKRLRKLASAIIVTSRDAWTSIKMLAYMPISLLPGPIGWWLRRHILGRSISMGKNVKIDELVRVDRPCGLKIGDETFVGRGSFIHAGGTVDIGANVLIGPYVKIWSADHQFGDRNIPIREQGHEFSPVVIGDDAWLGVSCIVLKGVTIGRGAVIGAGSVVTKDVAPYCVVAGIPAKPIGSR